MMIYEIEKISSLPSPSLFVRRCQALAIVDAILMPDWEYRYFSFDASWDAGSNEQMASMRDGSGNHYFVLISEYGIVGKIFCKEAVSDSSYSLDDVPSAFDSFKNEVAFMHNESTAYFYNLSEAGWSVSPSSPSGIPLLKFLASDPSYYSVWASNYYELSLDESAVEHVFRTLSVDRDIIKKLNKYASVESLREDIKKILR